MAVHEPVLLRETVDALAVREGGRYLDGTLGSGGHAEAILRAAPGVTLLGMDRDPDALEEARARLGPWGEQTRIVRGDFRELEAALDRAGWDRVDGILLDLGVSSLQLDRPERGFSFLRDGPLDMRMDPANPLTAERVVNEYPRERLRDILREFGEERFAGRVAGAIAREREEEPIRTTSRLAGIVCGVLGSPRFGEIHPATRTFQAVRMEVNGELAALETALPAGVRRLKAGGRMAVISFHSLEDRMVKRFFREREHPCTCPPQFPRCLCGRVAEGRVVTRRPLTAGEEERARNPRSRSAKLRVFAREDG